MNLRGKRILIVEDDPMIRELVRIWLRQSEAEFTTAGNGQEALEECSRTVFDVILCDFMMPAMSGREFMLEFRERVPGRRSIVVMTALEKEDIADLPRTSLFGVLKKPFELETLQRTVFDCATQPTPRLPIKDDPSGNNTEHSRSEGNHPAAVAAG